VPGYEPFLLCDFHVHTTWSDGRLSVREVVDLYGRTGRFDVIAITDHILMKRDLLGRAARLASLGLKHFSVTKDRFDQYLDDIACEAARARRLYDLLVIPGAEITQNHLRSKKNSHIVALNIKEYISADQRADEILKEIRRQGGVSIACHPHHRTTRRIEIGTCYLWEHRKRLSPLVDLWEAANRDDLFSITSLKHYPYIANSDFHKAKHLYSWKTLVRSEKNWDAIAFTLRENVDIALTLYRNGTWAA
jgi:predicted metal-dependent phosphoesterase TrpH